MTIYEGSSRVGGVIQSLRKDGYLAEFGPNTLLETSPKSANSLKTPASPPAGSIPILKPRPATSPITKGPIAMPGSPLGFFTD